MKNEMRNQDRMLIQEQYKGRIIKNSEILYVEGDDNYCKLILTDKAEFVVCRTLKSYEEELDSNFFFRCHKSCLVNIEYVSGYLKCGSKFFIILYDKSRILVARRRVSQFKRIFHNKN